MDFKCDELISEKTDADSRALTFQACFLKWMAAVHTLTQGELIAIDGKTLRGSYNREDRSSTIHMISAYATANKLVLGQLKTDKKSNESVPWALKLTG